MKFTLGEISLLYYSRFGETICNIGILKNIYLVLKIVSSQDSKKGCVNNFNLIIWLSCPFLTQKTKITKK